MPETKINVGSPFFKKYQKTGLNRVSVDVYVYSGDKEDDTVEKVYTLIKTPVNGNDYVIFDLGEIIKDYLQPTITTPLNSNVDYAKWVRLDATLQVNGLVALSSEYYMYEYSVIAVPLQVLDASDREVTYTFTQTTSNGTLRPLGELPITSVPVSFTGIKRMMYQPHIQELDGYTFTGSDSFTYKASVSDGEGGTLESDLATVTFNVLEFDWDTTVFLKRWFYYPSSSCIGGYCGATGFNEATAAEARAEIPSDWNDPGVPAPSGWHMHYKAPFGVGTICVSPDDRVGFNINETTYEPDFGDWTAYDSTIHVNQYEAIGFFFTESINATYNVSTPNYYCVQLGLKTNGLIEVVAITTPSEE